MKRGSDGTYHRIPVGLAFDEIASRLAEILERDGPRAVAHYGGTGMGQSVHAPALADSFMDGIGSGMRFSANTIDQPGKQIAKGLHGYWLAPPQGFDRPEVVLWIGLNPLMTYTGKPFGHPADFFADLAARHARLIVIDPRRTESARRATLHLQPRPGHDVAILAAMIRTIIREDLFDREFVRENVDGLQQLRDAVDPFDAERVATLADVPADDLLLAARTFARARRGYAVAGTGPNMGTAQGTLLEYLVLALDTLCGHYLRAGEVVQTVGSLSATPVFRAQAHPPVEAFGFGQQLRFRSLADTLGGLPVAALCDEILEPGEGRVRALVVLGGNPVAAFPDQVRTAEAMRDLELLVTIDMQMSSPAQMAHYVIASTMSLEVPRIRSDAPPGGYANGYTGYAESIAQYAAPITERPPGSDLVEEWEVYWELATRMGISLSYNSPWASLYRDGPPTPASIPPPLDMSRKPTTDEMIELITSGARIPLDEVKRHPHGISRPPEVAPVVQPKDLGWTGRLDIGNHRMIADLATVADWLAQGSVETRSRSGTSSHSSRMFRLIARRMHQINSSLHIAEVDRGRPYNPAFIHPDHLRQLGIVDGDRVEIISDHSSVIAIVASDPHLRHGVISMAHCFGAAPDGRDDDVEVVGSSVGRLLTFDAVFDPYSGQPLMSNVPVDVRVLAERPTSARRQVNCAVVPAR